jgi:phage terminase small subunit
MAGKPGRSGRKRKPSALRTGHRRYDNVEPRPADGPIEPPPDLSAAALIVWHRLLPQLQDMRVVTTADAEALGVLSTLVALFYAEPSSRLAGQIRGYMVEFGLSPSSRASLHAPEPDNEPDSPYAGFGFLG